ncbi:fasciclin domain-containing protein [Tropicimonas aquimaris]|uniref:Fasciclin domain-containing protein n=1 Tax=Tropicimonas aquimaris TaxID=914152 RepID=A0ABW3IRY9_9RHOB
MDKTITEIVLESGAPGEFDRNGDDFDILRDAVVTAGLADALADPDAELTVFAPVDSAFTGLAGALGYEGASERGAFKYIVESLTLLGGGDAIPLLTDILTYHVAAGALEAADVIDAGEVETLQGGILTLDAGTTPPSLIDADDGVANPGLIATDIMASNGVIHALDGVLLPLAVSDILGRDSTDFIIGGDESMIYETKGGTDFISAGGGADLVRAGKGDDVALGRAGSDVLFGNGGHDSLFGHKGGDILMGNGGDDILDGGQGQDQLTGGRGEDTFVFSEGYGKDTVVDFRNGHDTIDVSGLGITTFDEIEAAVVEKNYGTVLNFGDGDRLVLLGTDESRLDDGDFIFA